LDARTAAGQARFRAAGAGRCGLIGCPARGPWRVSVWLAKTFVMHPVCVESVRAGCRDKAWQCV